MQISYTGKPWCHCKNEKEKEKKEGIEDLLQYFLIGYFNKFTYYLTF